MSQPPPPLRPPLRQGPRPLPLHLGWVALSSMSSGLALASLNNGSLNWKPALADRAAQWSAAAAGLAPEAIASAVERAGRQRLAAFLGGVMAYRRHPYRRDLAPVPSIWQAGPTALLDFGGDLPPSAPVLLLVPSLINRAYILDLAEGRSLCRWLATAGVRALLVDWGTPGALECGFDLTDAICGPLEAALDAALDRYGGPIGLGGYCMGGLLALGLASRRPRDVAHAILLATPYDFHASLAEVERLAAAMPFVLPWVERIGFLPTDGLQALFAGLDPYLVITKFAAFARLGGTSPAATAFVALEDWINDGVPLAGPIARACLADWYTRNTVARGNWRVAGRAVRAEALGEIPALVLVPQGDRIVPPASAAALAHAWPGARLQTVPLGHIGMIASARAKPLVWQPIADWCATHA